MRTFAALVLMLAGCAAHSAATPDGGPAAHAITDDGHGNYTITLAPFTVAPGGERYVCQNFANPFGGGDGAIHAFASHLTPGAHHMLLFYQPSASDGPLADCSGSEFAPGPYGSQRPDDALTFPDGVAAVVAPSDGFRVQAHYLNATPAPLDVTVTITMARVDESTVVDRAAVLFFSNSAINVPAGASGVVVSKTCTVPFAANLVQATGHMHQHGRDFTATAAGATLFTSTVYSDVTPALYAPPLALPSGTAVTFACTYDNSDGTTPLVFGDSAITDEMCIFSAQFYPAPFGGFSCL
jgi:hypothetical protein